MAVRRPARTFPDHLSVHAVKDYKLIPRMANRALVSSWFERDPPPQTHNQSVSPGITESLPTSSSVTLCVFV